MLQTIRRQLDEAVGLTRSENLVVDVGVRESDLDRMVDVGDVGGGNLFVVEYDDAKLVENDLERVFAIFDSQNGSGQSGIMKWSRG